MMAIDAAFYFFENYMRQESKKFEESSTGEKSDKRTDSFRTCSCI